MAVFTPPVEPYVPPVPYGDKGEGNPPWRLMHYFAPSMRGVNVFKMADGSYRRDDVQGVWPTTPTVPNDAIAITFATPSLPPIVTPIDVEVLFVYYGAHSYVVDDAEAAALTAAGYGANLT